VPVTSDLFTYLSVAAIALIVAVELHVFTPVKMNQAFAVSFVVVATLAAAGVWAVARFVLDETLGTAFLLDPTLTEAEIEHDLMLEFVYSTAAGVLGGVVFEWYFRRLRRRENVVPGEVEAAIEAEAERTRERRGVKP
jgi:NhaP-type Na+/H+ or K+/H+ antiporter